MNALSKTMHGTYDSNDGSPTSRFSPCKTNSQPLLLSVCTADIAPETLQESLLLDVRSIILGSVRRHIYQRGVEAAT